MVCGVAGEAVRVSGLAGETDGVARLALVLGTGDVSVSHGAGGTLEEWIGRISSVAVAGGAGSVTGVNAFRAAPSLCGNNAGEAFGEGTTDEFASQTFWSDRATIIIGGGNIGSCARGAADVIMFCVIIDAVSAISGTAGASSGSDDLVDVVSWCTGNTGVGIGRIQEAVVAVSYGARTKQTRTT